MPGRRENWLSDKRRQKYRTPEDMSAFRDEERWAARSGVELFAHVSRNDKQLNEEQSYQSDPATALGRPVDDFSRRFLLLLGNPQPPAHLHSPLANDRRHRPGLGSLCVVGARPGNEQ